MTEKNRSSYARKVEMPVPVTKIPDLSEALGTVNADGIKRKFLDIPYDTQSERQKIDIYLPETGDGPFPTIIFQHGGAFYGGSRKDGQANYVIDGVNRGYAVASVGQRLGGETQFPYPLFDFKAAIRFLRANAGKYMLDGNNFASAGDSAGSFYAMFAAATQGNSAFEDFSQGNADYSSAVKAVVNFFGDCDTLAQCLEWEELANSPGYPKDFWDEVNGSIQEPFFGAWSSRIPGLLYFANPLNFVTPDFPPIYIQHGITDSVVSIEQSYGVAEVVGRICGKERVTLEAVDGFDHVDPRFLEKQYQDRVFAFLDEHLK